MVPACWLAEMELPTTPDLQAHRPAAPPRAVNGLRPRRSTGRALLRRRWPLPRRAADRHPQLGTAARNPRTTLRTRIRRLPARAAQGRPCGGPRQPQARPRRRRSPGREAAPQEHAVLRRRGRGGAGPDAARLARPQARQAVVEAALAHVVQNKVEAAYARSDLFERRRRLMDDWSAHVVGDTRSAGR